MAIVKDYYSGHTHIIIKDDCCVKTKEEKDRILRNVAEIAVNALSQQRQENSTARIK